MNTLNQVNYWLQGFTRMVNGQTTCVFNKPTVIQGVCERASKSQVCSESILILHLICSGMNTRGPLPLLLKVSLEDYHTTDTLHFKEGFFHFTTHQKLGQWEVNVWKLEAVKTMSNSRQLSGYSGRIAALQLNSGPLHITPVPDTHITLPLSVTLCIRLNPVVTTLPRLPCCTMSSPCSVYIFYLVVFSLDLTYFHWTWPSPNSGCSLSTLWAVYLSP